MGDLSIVGALVVLMMGALLVWPWFA